MLQKSKSGQSQKEMVLRQSNKISRSPTVSSLRQAKVYRYFLMKAKSELLEKEYHRVYQEELKDFLGSHDWENLKENIEFISKINIRWDLLPQKGGGEKLLWGISPLLADCELKQDEKGRLYFQFSFSAKMREELSNPKFFRDFDLRLIRNFRSNYALKFYEFCLASINPGQKRIVTEFIPKDAFWELLGLRKDEYKNYYNFVKRVVNPAVSEVNEMTDLKIELVRKKVSPGNYSFCFKIERQNIQTHLDFADPELTKVYERFQNASKQTQESLEKEFFLQHPESKSAYSRKERNAFFESWLLANYFQEEAVVGS